MEPITIRLSEENRVQSILLNPEDSFFVLECFSIGNGSEKTESRLYATIKIVIEKSNGKIESKKIDFNNQDHTDFKEINSNFHDINGFNTQRIELSLIEGNTLENFSIEFKLKKGRNKIEMISPIKKFQDFLSDRINNKIFFSGPFGSGKTTFLNYYFDTYNPTAYNVFTLFPVNYSVASNEDIFKYIKADILLQLMASGVEFDKDSISHLRSLEEYIYLKPKKVILSLLETFSKIHPISEILSNGLKGINQFVNEVESYKKSQDQDDNFKALQFIEELYEKEGSLFEDNFFSQLIIYLLEKIKKDSGKPNVLIIEDLDRIDPDHVFRILNIISAHYDIYTFSEGENYSNKFGFDKIIIVSDIQNIQNVFHHKYGINADFNGYINKFYSRTPFYYDNKSQIAVFIEEFHIKNSKNGNKYQINSLIQLLKFLHAEEMISLREIIKMNTIDFNNYDWNQVRNSTLLKYGPYTKALCFLVEFYGKERLIYMFETIKQKIYYQKFNLENEGKILLASLGFSDGNKTISAYGNSTYTYNCNTDTLLDCIISVSDIRCFDGDRNVKEIDLSFNTVDFYSLLIENVKRIGELIK